MSLLISDQYSGLTCRIVVTMWIADFNSYKAFLASVMAQYPNKGRGLGQRLSKLLNVEPSVITLILKHDRNLSPDQALAVAEFFGFDTQTTEMFLLMVDLERAESKALKAHLTSKLEGLRAEANKIKNAVSDSKEISDLDKGVFYSNWYFSAIRMVAGLPGVRTVDEIASRLGLTRKTTGEALKFLVANGLLLEENGRYVSGPAVTSINDSSVFLNNHRRNWRDRAKVKFEGPEDTDYFLSVPMTISEKDAERFKSEIRELVKKFMSTVPDSKEETARCLNIDWFKF